MIRACANGGDGRAKGMFAAIGMFLFRLLSTSRRQMVEKAIEAGNLFHDPLNDHYSKMRCKFSMTLFCCCEGHSS